MAMSKAYRKEVLATVSQQVAKSAQVEPGAALPRPRLGRGGGYFFFFLLCESDDLPDLKQPLVGERFLDIVWVFNFHASTMHPHRFDGSRKGLDWGLRIGDRTGANPKTFSDGSAVV